MTMRWAACVACGAGIFAATPCPGQEVLHRNGPWTTRKHFDCLPPDTKTSLLQTNLGLRFYGFGHQRQGNNRVADDFVVPEGEYWIIERVWFPAYQTDSGYQQSTMTWLSLMVWDGPPDQAESVVLFGDPDTNRLESSVFADVFRHSDQQCLLNRPVFLNEGACFSSVPCPMRLGPGTYWVDWQADGTLPSGPWVPPVTYAGEQGKPGANAIQFVGSEGWWVPLADAEWVPQDLPFIIEGRRTTCPADIDVDEQTGQADLATLLGAFGTRRGDRDYCAAADLDANGIIGHADLATLLANWGCQDGRCKCKIIFLGGEALLKCDRKGGEAGDFKFKVTLTNSGKETIEVDVRVYDDDGLAGRTLLVDLGKMECKPGESSKIFEFTLNCDAQCDVVGKDGDSNESEAEWEVVVETPTHILCSGGFDVWCTPLD